MFITKNTSKNISGQKCISNVNGSPDKITPKQTNKKNAKNRGYKNNSFKILKN